MIDDTIDAWRMNRDRKLFKMLDPDEPAWLVDEEVALPNEAVFYTVVHRWNKHGWARRHFMYDIPGDVVHFRGSTPVNESDLPKMKPEQRIKHHRVLY